MTYGLTPQGFNKKPYTVIKQELDAAFKVVYSDNIGSEPDGSIPAESAIGQFIGIFGGDLADLWELGQAITSAFDPDKAEDAAQDSLCAITGTIRNGQRDSVAILTATGDVGTTLPIGRVVSVQGAKTRFDTDTTVTLVALTAWAVTTVYAVGDRVSNASRAYLCIGAGTSAGAGGPNTTAPSITDNTVTWRYLGEGLAAIDVGVTAEVAGPFAAVSGSLSVIETPVSGWKTATNVLDAVIGAVVESSAALRIRRENELTGNADGTVNAIRANVLRVGQRTTNPVTACTVFQNTTMVTNADGLPPKSVEVLALGGVDQDVRTEVFDSVDAGIETYGNNSGTVTDSAGNPNTVKFSRATEVLIWIEIHVTKDPGSFPIDGVDQIKARIIAGLPSYIYSFGRDVSAWAVGGTIGTNSKDGIFVPAVTGVLNVTDCSVGDTPAPPSGSVLISIGVREIARFDTSRINVTLVDGTP